MRLGVVLAGHLDVPMENEVSEQSFVIICGPLGIDLDARVLILGRPFGPRGFYPCFVVVCAD